MSITPKLLSSNVNPLVIRIDVKLCLALNGKPLCKHKVKRVLKKLYNASSTPHGTKQIIIAVSIILNVTNGGKHKEKTELLTQVKRIRVVA